MSTFTPDQIVASIDRHFRRGAPSLPTTQLIEHEETLSCRACEATLAAVARTDSVESDRTPADSRRLQRALRAAP